MIVKNYKKTEKQSLPNIKSTDIAFIMFTSGTTSKAKGVMLSHENILSNLQAIKKYFDICRDDHILISRPLCHIAVLTGEFLVSLSLGLKISFYDKEFSPRKLLDFINSNKCSILCYTPTIYNCLSKFVRKDDYKIKKATISGEKLSGELAKRLIDIFPDCVFYHVYGLTEASPRVTFLEPNEFRKRIGSIGKPLCNVKIMIVKKDNTEVNFNEIGELIVSGPNVMMGYYNDKKLTKEKIRNGWLYTGDLAYKDKEGFYYIVGRQDNMIIKSGINIYPQEIENELLKDLRIYEVMVYGLYEEKYGQKICAQIVAEEGVDLDYIFDLCKSVLPEYKWPSFVEIVSELQKNISGKLMRNRNY